MQELEAAQRSGGVARTSICSCSAAGLPWLPAAPVHTTATRVSVRGGATSFQPEPREWVRREGEQELKGLGGPPDTVLMLSPLSGAWHRGNNLPCSAGMRHRVPAAGQRHTWVPRPFCHSGVTRRRGFSRRTVVSKHPLPLFRSGVPPCQVVCGLCSAACHRRLRKHHDSSPDHRQTKRAKRVSAVNGSD